GGVQHGGERGGQGGGGEGRAHLGPEHRGNGGVARPAGERAVNPPRGWKTGARAPMLDNPSPREFPETPSMPEITLYTSASCGYCVAAKNFLRSRGVEWREVRIDLDPEERTRMVERARRTSVPQIFIGDTHVGGYDDMMALHRAGELEPLLRDE